MSALLLNSLLVATATTMLATTFGLAAAITLISLPSLPRRFALGLCLIALALPPFLVTNCWLHYLGNTGVWKAWLPLNIFGPRGAIFMLSLMFWPIPLVAALGSWRALDASHFEAEPSLRGAQLLRWLLWPAARNAVTCAAVVVFALALNQFSVPVILQVKVLPVEAWIQFSTALKPARALAVSWPLIAVPLAAILFLRPQKVPWLADTNPPPARRTREQLGELCVVAASLVTGLVVLASIALPIFQLFTATRTWAEIVPVWKASWPVALNSALFAGVAAALTTVLAMATWRSRLGWGLWVIFLMPGMLLSIGLIWMLNRPALELIYRSAAVVIFALTLRYAAPVWGLVGLAFSSHDPALVEAGRLESLSRWSVMRHVFWPRFRTTVLLAAYAAYLLCLWDVETVMLLYPPGGETMALRIFNLLHYGHTAQVNALCVILLGMAGAPALAYAAVASVTARRTV